MVCASRNTIKGVEEKLLAIIRDRRRLLQTISFMGVETRFTKKILVEKFGLKDKSEQKASSGSTKS